MARTPPLSTALSLSRLAARRDLVGDLSVFARHSVAPVHSRLLVLRHGLVVSSTFLRPALRRIGNHHRAYAPDLPGYGHFDRFVGESRGRHAVALEDLERTAVGTTVEGG